VLITGTGGTRELFQLIENPYEFRDRVQSQLVGLQQPQSSGPKAW
jgi:hypothetical protein